MAEGKWVLTIDAENSERPYKRFTYKSGNGEIIIESKIKGDRVYSILVTETKEIFPRRWEPKKSFDTIFSLLTKNDPDWEEFSA